MSEGDKGEVPVVKKVDGAPGGTPAGGEPPVDGWRLIDVEGSMAPDGGMVEPGKKVDEK